MHLEIFALCDSAADYGGKLSLLGAFDGIFAREAPVVHAHCAVALRLRVAKVEEGRHHIRYNLIDPDGKLVVPSIEASVEVRVPDSRDSMAINLIVNLQQLKFERFDRYTLDLAIDGRQEASLPVTVAQRKRPEPRV
ncbi:MAG: hypothetical protein R3F07_00605 [Opitutaceae bacterium]